MPNAFLHTPYYVAPILQSMLSHAQSLLTTLVPPPMFALTCPSLAWTFTS
jgi:hypothetical protein